MILFERKFSVFQLISSSIIISNETKIKLIKILKFELFNENINEVISSIVQMGSNLNFKKCQIYHMPRMPKLMDVYA